jgi:putative transposase
MSDKYKIIQQNDGHFLTLTVVDWIDVFTYKRYKLTILDSLKYCQKNKGLEIYGYCLMSNHLHLIARATGQQGLSAILRDFKKFTAKAIISQIQEEKESRREWLLDRFAFAGKYLHRIENFKFWQDGNHAEIIYSPAFFFQKLDYIHQNPVKELIVENPEDYLFSSARNYAGHESLLYVVLETPMRRGF